MRLTHELSAIDISWLEVDITDDVNEIIELINRRDHNARLFAEQKLLDVFEALESVKGELAEEA